MTEYDWIILDMNKYDLLWPNRTKNYWIWLNMTEPDSVKLRLNMSEYDWVTEYDWIKPNMSEYDQTWLNVTDFD